MVAATNTVGADRAVEMTGTDETADTVIVVDRVQVTAIKQGLMLRTQPVAATIVGLRGIERGRVEAVKDLSQTVPNFYSPDYGSRMTSSIYVRGLGARIDQPVVGLNVDNVPVMNKDNYDIDLADAERIEVLRGPQSTLYGRNTMGGVINVYTLSPLSYEGVRLGAEYSTGNTYRFRISSYYKLNPDLGMSVAGYYNRSDGLFENSYTGEKCDWERMGGGRWKVQWRAKNGLRVDNTFSFSMLEQGGYPYASVATGRISYDDLCSYDRKTFSDGLTVRYDAAKFSVASITSYQFSDDEMNLDQDFLPLPYFTLKQARREHSLTQDVVFRSHDRQAYNWLFGAFGFYRHGDMKAPVLFKQMGVDELIFKNANAGGGDITYYKTSDELPLGSAFVIPNYGLAAYHQSEYRLGKWHFTAGLRLDFERTKLRYRSFAEMSYLISINGADPIPGMSNIDYSSSVAHSYIELLPKAAATYRFNDRNNLYVSIAKGYKSGGFNTQLFSDILETQLKWAMVSGIPYHPGDEMSYKPEYSWNYELGGHFSCMDGDVRGDFALFYIDCRDQQLTVFPEGQSTGRMMTNAGRTRSLGGELSLQAHPWRNLEITTAYGYTDARFVRYDNGRADFAGNRIPYAPANTLSAIAAWTIPTGVAWLGDLVLRGGVKGAGRIWWNEENTLSQPFYVTAEAAVRIEHRHYSLSLWGRNLADKRYDLFYFKSMGNEFVQRALPRTFGATLTINFD